MSDLILFIVVCTITVCYLKRGPAARSLTVSCFACPAENRTS